MTDLPKTLTVSAYQALNPAGQARVRDLLQALRSEPFSGSMSREDLRGWLARSRQKGLDPKAVWEGLLDVANNREHPLLYALDGVFVMREAGEGS